MKSDGKHRLNGCKPKSCFRGIKDIDISFIAYDVVQDTDLYNSEVTNDEG